MQPQETKEIFELDGNPVFVETLGFISVCSMAFAVNFGVALVSLASLLMVISASAFLVKFAQIRGVSQSRISFFQYNNCRTPWNVLIALAWILLSVTWSIAPWNQVGWELVRSARILVIPITLFLITSPKQALKVLEVWVFGQLFVILTSYWLWFGMPAPWVTSNAAVDYFTPYTSYLEQPIMSSVAFAVIWFFRKHFSAVWGDYLKLNSNLNALWLVYFVLFLIFFNVGFLMVGRSGMLSLIIVLTIISWQFFSKHYRKFVVLMPFLLFGALFLSSTNFKNKILEIPKQVAEYNRGNINISQAYRLEWWHRSLQAIGDRPVVGYGVGSWPLAYEKALKGEKGIKADSPHEQFLLWWVEGGSIGFLLLISIYIGIFRDASRLEERAKYSIISVTAVLFFTSLMNCPLQGAGISEFFCLMIGVLLVFMADENAGLLKVPSKRE